MQLPTGLTVARPLLVATLVLVLVLGAAGCSDPAKPGTIDTTAPDPTRSSATPSATPTATATPVKQQVEAAVRTYYAELTRAAQTNDTSRLKLMLAKSCPCYRAVRVIDTGARQGESTPQAKWRLHELRVHDVTGGAAVAEVRYRVSPYDVLDRSGQRIDHIGRRVSHLDLSLVRIQGRWLLTNVFDLES